MCLQRHPQKVPKALGHCNAPGLAPPHRQPKYLKHLNSSCQRANRGDAFLRSTRRSASPLGHRNYDEEPGSPNLEK
eukprot:3692986-Amphidinium_carterae.1